MNPRAKAIEYKSPYSLIITFTNEEVKLFDLQPYLNYPVYQSLRDEDLCSKAFIEQGIVVWNEDLDFDPNRFIFRKQNFGTHPG